MFSFDKPRRLTHLRIDLRQRAAVGAAGPERKPPAGPGLELIQRSCISCHDIY